MKFKQGFFDKLEEMGVIKKVNKKTKKSSIGKAVDKAIEEGIVKPTDDLYGKKYAQIYKDGGSVDKKKAEEGGKAAKEGIDTIETHESMLGKAKKQLKKQTEKKNERLKELEAELGLKDGGMVKKYNHGGSVKSNARMQGVKPIQIKGFRFNHKIS